MRVSNNFINTKTSFGYDKKLNAELKERLASHPDKEWAKDLLTMNNYVNRLETRVSREAKKKVSPTDSKYQDYLDMFLSLKNTLAGFVSVTFTDLNYADREFVHYHDEFVKGGSKFDDWHADAFEVLEDWISPEIEKKYLKKKDDAGKKPYVPKFDEEGVEIQEVPVEQKPKLSPKVQSIVDQITGHLSPKSLLEVYNPSADAPKSFADVAGMETLKRDLQEGIIQLINDPEQAQKDFEDYGKKTPKTILLYGPPGCGKTYITQALSGEVKSPLLMLNISNAGSSYINMTSKNIKAAFDEAIALADKSNVPCLLFMDEVDTMGFDRGSRMEPDDLKQVGTLLQCMDNAKQHNLILLSATNKYNILDPAVRRRYDMKVFVDIPDKKAITALLQKQLTPLKKGQKLLQSQDDLESVSKLLYGFSNSSICEITRQAALNAMRRDRADIAIEDYQKAVKETGEEKPNRKDYMAESKLDDVKIGFGS